MLYSTQLYFAYHCVLNFLFFVTGKFILGLIGRLPSTNCLIARAGSHSFACLIAFSFMMIDSFSLSESNDILVTDSLSDSSGIINGKWSANLFLEVCFVKKYFFEPFYRQSLYIMNLLLFYTLSLVYTIHIHSLIYIRTISLVFTQRHAHLYIALTIAIHIELITASS